MFLQVQAAQAALAEVHAEAAEAAAAAEARLAAAAEAAAGQQQQLQQRVSELQGEVESLRAQLQQNQVRTINCCTVGCELVRFVQLASLKLLFQSSTIALISRALLSTKSWASL
jgi:erythromycin esterase-like protein